MQKGAKDMFYRLKQYIYRFMYGRNGADALAKGLLLAYFVLWAVNIAFGSLWAYILMQAVLVYVVFRMFSRDLPRRQKENADFLAFLSHFRVDFAYQKRKWQDRKTACYRTCPHCKARIKLPNKKGKHTVECPRCHKDFKVHISI